MDSITKLILLDGGPASGKNTLGNLLVKQLEQIQEKTVLLDMDTYVEEFCPTWIWESVEQKQNDLKHAKNNFLRDIHKNLEEQNNVIAIGDRFLTKKDLDFYIKTLTVSCPVYLYHLSVPLEIRKQRLHQRGPHSLIDLDKDQKDRNEVISWPGYVYKNNNTPDIDTNELMKLIQSDNGLVAS